MREDLRCQQLLQPCPYFSRLHGRHENFESLCGAGLAFFREGVGARETELVSHGKVGKGRWEEEGLEQGLRERESQFERGRQGKKRKGRGKGRRTSENHGVSSCMTSIPTLSNTASLIHARDLKHPLCLFNTSEPSPFVVQILGGEFFFPPAPPLRPREGRGGRCSKKTGMGGTDQSYVDGREKEESGSPLNLFSSSERGSTLGRKANTHLVILPVPPAAARIPPLLLLLPLHRILPHLLPPLPATKPVDRGLVSLRLLFGFGGGLHRRGKQRERGRHRREGKIGERRARFATEDEGVPFRGQGEEDARASTRGAVLRRRQLDKAVDLPLLQVARGKEEETELCLLPPPPFLPFFPPVVRPILLRRQDRSLYPTPTSPLRQSFRESPSRKSWRDVRAEQGGKELLLAFCPLVRHRA